MRLNDDIKLKETRRIHRLFRQFQEDMRNIWEEFNYLESSIKNSEINEFKLKSLFVEQLRQKKQKHAGGMRTRFLNGNNAKNHFIDSISLFEVYISNLATKIYKIFPEKIVDDNTVSDEKILIKIILDYETKEEILNHFIEKKVRNIFYGNPVDILTKDKCKFQLNNIFIDENKYKKVTKFYKEMIATRNIIIHNQGRVDNKYLKEVTETDYRLKQKIIITDTYLRGSISILLGIAAKITESVIEQIFNSNTKGKLYRVIKTFENSYRNNWYDTLLNHQEE